MAELLRMVYIYKGIKHSAALADNIQEIPYVQQWSSWKKWIILHRMQWAVYGIQHEREYGFRTSQHSHS